MDVTLDCSSVRAECDVWLAHFGLTSRSPITLSLLKRLGLPQSFRQFEPDDFVDLAEHLKRRWLALTPEQQNARAKVNYLLFELDMCWAHPHIIRWLTRKQVPFFDLAVDDLQEISTVLEMVLEQLEELEEMEDAA